MVDVRTDLIQRLIRAGTGSDEEIAVLLDDVGLPRFVQALTEEIVFRCPEPANTMPIDVALEVTYGKESHTSVLRVAQGAAVTVVEEESATVWSKIGISAADLLRRLFGPADSRRTGDFHNSFVPAPEDRAQLQAMYFKLDTLMRAAAQATHTVMSGCSARCGELGNLSIRYGSDKWASFHWYTPHYERHFAPYRDRPVRVLEIGIGGYEDDLGGPSLKMWKRYFHRGLIFGLDLYDKSALNETRLTALTGDQGDPGALVAMAEEHGPFDIIIDDGSHMNDHVHTSFRALFPYVRTGGLYVVEDLQTAYFSDFGGSSGGVAEPHTSIGLLKALLDDVHFQEHATEDGAEPNLTQSTVTGLHVYHNIAFVEKGVNGEDTLPAWMHADAWEALGAK
ncbi:class I SAM-dependent methyltransferase [Actinomadura craniellae]|uniref:Class I SAM-dependent methyltransferase n=1 Tax=Actinomadura craniellae TaxID=2231787 RepID=A0A365H0V9_9ACTN|nr:class I SAM-dependent methyltransferase [Actinomadura craniellae]RAY12701.1 class I SAM-dependent methyltransferase [Actinomadura craniellae]